MKCIAPPMLATGEMDWRWRRARNEKSAFERTGGAQFAPRTVASAAERASAVLPRGEKEGREAAAGAGLLSEVAGGCLDRGAPPLRGAFPCGGARVGVMPALPPSTGLLLISICELSDPETHGRPKIF